MRRRFRAVFEPLQERAEEMLSILQTGRGTQQNPRDRAHVYIIKRPARHFNDGFFIAKIFYRLAIDWIVFLIITNINLFVYISELLYYYRKRSVCYAGLELRRLHFTSYVYECCPTSALEFGHQVLYIGAVQVSKSLPHTRFLITKQYNRFPIFSTCNCIQSCVHAHIFPCVLHCGVGELSNNFSPFPFCLVFFPIHYSIVLYSVYRWYTWYYNII